MTTIEVFYLLGREVRQIDDFANVERGPIQVFD
jgi:hypothetical protein